jgi:hypothetical protein
MEVVGGEERTTTCQILVVVPFAIHVVMQTISCKMIPKCSIVVMKSLNLPETSPHCLLQANDLELIF